MQIRKTKKHTFILYKYNDFNNDFEYIMEYQTLKQLKTDNNFKIHDKTIYKYITDNIDNIKSKIENKYIIIKEDIL